VSWLQTRRQVAAALVWAVPVLVILVVYFSPSHVVSADTLLAGLLALAVVALAARRPDRALLVLIVLLPFQGFLLAKLWAWGAPVSLVRHLSAWKETVAIGVVIAGLRGFLASKRRADALDRLGLAFVAFTALYLLVQHAIIPGAPGASNVRLLGFREDAGFVILLLGARHAPFPEKFLDRAAKTALLVGAVVGGIALYEALDSVAWNQFVVHTIKYTQYQLQVLNVKPQNFNDIRIYGTIGGTSIIRSGSVFLNAVNCGFYLVLSFAIGVERIARGRSRPWALISLLLVTAGLLLTQTRSAILAALVATIVVFQPIMGRRAHRRTQLRLVLTAVALCAIPVAIGTGLAQRLLDATPAQDTSAAQHVVGFWDGVDAIQKHPFGQGLGTSAGTGQRFQTQVAGSKGVVIPENNYLQYGAELGVIPMLVFIALTIAVVLALRRAARQWPSVMTGAMWAAGAGLAVGAWFLQTWIEFAVAWTFWGLAGATLGVAATSSRGGGRHTDEAADRFHGARQRRAGRGSRQGSDSPLASSRR
jgi:hypothetical protein